MNISPQLLVNAQAKFQEITEREQCEESLYAFLKRGWKYIDPAPFVGGWHLEAIAEHLQAVNDGQIRRLIINVPPRTSKSSICSVAWPAFTWAQSRIGPCSGPHVQFLSASYAQTLSLRDSVKNRRLIESPFYKKYWGNRFSMTSDVNTKGRFENDKGGYRIATSVDGALTGEGAQCFVSGTKVATTNGPVNIEEIMVGNSVFAFDHLQGRVVRSEVVATRTKTSDEIYEIHTVAGHSLRCTGTHPIFSPGRGYIPASEMGVGDRLLRKEWSPDRAALDVCRLRLADAEAVVRDKEGAETTQPGLLLQRDVQAGALCNKIFQVVSGLRRSDAVSECDLLQPTVPSGGSLKSQVKKAVSSMWGNLYSFYKHVLLEAVLRCSPFSQNAWQPQFQIQGIGQILSAIQRDSRVSSNQRWAQVCGLRHGRWFNSKWKERVETKAISTSGASYRREYAEQYPGESGASVHAMSQEASSWDFDSIASITVYRGTKHFVHDIQVGRFNNFFAEGILAHNCILIDDPHNATEVESDLVRTGTLQWWDEAMSTRLNDQHTGAYVVIMQRLHQEDLTGHILRREHSDWTWLMLPMEHDKTRHCVTMVNGKKFWEDPRTEEGELLCPGRFNLESVKSLTKRLGDFSAAGQLQQLPVPRGGGLIKSDWWGQWTDATYPQFEYVIASLDTAYTEKEENDASALTIWGVYKNENKLPRIMMIYGWQDRLALPDLVERVAATCSTTPLPDSSKYKYSQRFRIDKLVIESKASGISVYQELYRTIGFSGQFGIDLFNPSKLGDKWARVFSVQHLFSEGLIYVPWPKEKEGPNKGQPGPKPYKWAEEIIDQITIFPRGAHDDYVDSMSMGLRWLRDSGLLLRNEEQAHDDYEELVYKGRSVPLYPV